MKKLTSIFFVCIILLNTMGYYGVFVGLHYRNDVAQLRALESKAYDQSETVTLNLPVSLPYMPDQASFERVNGKIEYKGELYRMIEQRYAKDNLTIVCIRDTEHKKIDRALADFVTTFTDQTADSKAPSKITLNFLKDYLPLTFSIRPVTSGWTAEVIHNSACGTLVPAFMASIVHPPERA